LEIDDPFPQQRNVGVLSKREGTCHNPQEE
jgi:hypothetical protein